MPRPTDKNTVHCTTGQMKHLIKLQVMTLRTSKPVRRVRTKRIGPRKRRSLFMVPGSLKTLGVRVKEGRKEAGKKTKEGVKEGVCSLFT